MFVFDVVPVILCALLCQAWPLRPALPHAGLGLTAWCQLPTAHCRSQEPAPGLAAFIPVPTGTEAAVWPSQALPSGPVAGSEWEPLHWDPIASLCLGHRVTRASTETQGSCCTKSIYDSVLHHWCFICFSDILDTSRVISEDGKKKVGAVCEAPRLGSVTAVPITCQEVTLAGVAALPAVVATRME